MGVSLQFLLYGALVLSILGTSGKQFAMKRCGALAGGVFNSACINFARAAICLIVSLVIWAIDGGGSTNALGHGLSILGGASTAICLLTWIIASTQVSLTLIEAAFTLTSMVIPLILAPFLYPGESVSVVQWIGCALVFASLFCFGNGARRKAEGGSLVGLIALFISAIGNGAAAISKKYYTYYVTAAGDGGVAYYTLLSFAVALLLFFGVFAVMALRKKQHGERVELPFRRTWIFILIAAVGLYVYELFATYASDLPSAIYYPLSRGLTLLATFLLDVIVFREKVTIKKLIGLVIILVAVVLINL